jgi:hypothetical protein
MDKHKPSARIKGYYNGGFSVADVGDIRREIDALHDEVEKLRSDHDLLFKFHHTHDALNKPVVPNQGKSCGHEYSQYGAKYWTLDKHTLLGITAYPICPYCPKPEVVRECQHPKILPEQNIYGMNKKYCEKCNEIYYECPKPVEPVKEKAEKRKDFMPNVVMWLCSICHGIEHRKLKHDDRSLL